MLCMNNLPSYMVWVNCCKNEYFCQRITCFGTNEKKSIFWPIRRGKVDCICKKLVTSPLLRRLGWQLHLFANTSSHFFDYMVSCCRSCTKTSFSKQSKVFAQRKVSATILDLWFCRVKIMNATHGIAVTCFYA